MTENHVMAMKRILRYWKRVEYYGLWYTMNEKFELKVYTNIDWVGNVDDIKSTSGGYFFLCRRLIPWIRKKKICISQYIIEIEYVVVVVNCSIIVLIMLDLTPS